MKGISKIMNGMGIDENQELVKHDGPDYRCAWTGCQNGGVISESTSGGRFYCREHASQAIPWYDEVPVHWRNPVLTILEKQGKPLPPELVMDERR